MLVSCQVEPAFVDVFGAVVVDDGVGELTSSSGSLFLAASSLLFWSACLLVRLIFRLCSSQLLVCTGPSPTKLLPSLVFTTTVKTGSEQCDLHRYAAGASYLPLRNHGSEAERHPTHDSHLDDEHSR